MKRIWIVAIFLVTLAAAPAVAQSPEDLANEISGKVMSPFCPGVTLHDCPSQQALDLRDTIEDYARDGMTEDEIMDRLVADFGPSIRAEPSSEGAGVLAWILPSIAVLIGGALAWTLVRRWIARRDAGTEALQPVVKLSDDERSRLDTELRQLRKHP